jgi:NAD(P)-dependent dehydrogenase (short-subunit alcohol dehydrogenase family)
MLNIASLLDLSGQVAIVTGASRGIGKAIAQVFAQAGAKVALIARSADQLDEVSSSIITTLHHLPPVGGPPSTLLVLPTDIALESQVNAAVQKVLDTWGRVDILINNAGLISLGPVSSVQPADWERIISVNLTGAYLLCRAVTPIMTQQRYGRMINIASISAQTGGVSAGVHYSASKGGMLALTKTLARDLAQYNITVNAIAPGQIDADPNLLSPEARQHIISIVPLGRLGEPEEIAYAALFLASSMASYITGATLDVNGGILKR